MANQKKTIRRKSALDRLKVQRNPHPKDSEEAERWAERRKAEIATLQDRIGYV